MLSDDNGNTENCDFTLKECTCTISRGSVWGIIITLMVSVFSYFNLVIHMRSFYWLPGISPLGFSLSDITAYVHCFPFCLQVKSRCLVLLHSSL